MANQEHVKLIESRAEGLECLEARKILDLRPDLSMVFAHLRETSLWQTSAVQTSAGQDSAAQTFAAPTSAAQTSPMRTSTSA